MFRCHNVFDVIRIVMTYIRFFAFPSTQKKQRCLTCNYMRYIYIYYKCKVAKVSTIYSYIHIVTFIVRVILLLPPGLLKTKTFSDVKGIVTSLTTWIFSNRKERNIFVSQSTCSYETGLFAVVVFSALGRVLILEREVGVAFFYRRTLIGYFNDERHWLCSNYRNPIQRIVYPKNKSKMRRGKSPLQITMTIYLILNPFSYLLWTIL